MNNGDCVVLQNDALIDIFESGRVFDGTDIYGVDADAAGSIFDFYDKDGKLWIIQNSGVIAMDKATLLSGEVTDTIHYSFNHELTGSINANTWNYLDEDGTLYLSTRNGISEFAFQGVSNAAPKLCISRVIVDGQVYEHPTELRLDSSAQRITIDFAALVSYTNKPGRLTQEEMNIIRQHVNIGGEILKEFTALEGIADGAKYHHECYDGTGYSEGLAGLDIPQVARIIGVADSYDAMSGDRCYRKALIPEKIEEELLNHCGKQFDPEVVPHMMAMIEEGKVPVQVEK